MVEGRDAQVAAAEAIEPVPPPPTAPPAATVPFARQSAEISGIGRSELDRLAREVNASRLRHMELRAYASDDDPIEARKMALTRALAVQSYLVDQGVKVVGVDYLSVEQFKKPGAPAHHALLGNGVVIIEGLNLSEAEAGAYEMYCLPLKIKDGDGAPARVVLKR